VSHSYITVSLLYYHTTHAQVQANDVILFSPVKTFNLAVHTEPEVKINDDD